MLYTIDAQNAATSSGTSRAGAEAGGKRCVLKGWPQASSAALWLSDALLPRPIRMRVQGRAQGDGGLRLWSVHAVHAAVERAQNTQLCTCLRLTVALWPHTCLVLCVSSPRPEACFEIAHVRRGGHLDHLTQSLEYNHSNIPLFRGAVYCE